VKLEGIQVFGEAVIGLPVNLTVHLPNGSDQVFHSVTDGFGDYDLVVETAADPALLSVSIEAKGRAQPVQLDTFFHRTHAPVYVTLSDGVIPTAPGGRQGAVDEAPGSTTPRVNPVLVVALALGLVAAIVLSRRKGA
jgi:hypothetical protein